MEPVKIAFYSVKLNDNDPDSPPLQDLQKASPNSACVDIRCDHDYIIYTNEYQMMATGLYVSIPDGYEIQVRPRSGISAKTHAIFKNTIGTIDSDYRGREIFVIWHNLGQMPIKFERGDRIAQLKVERVIPFEYYEVDSIATFVIGPFAPYV